MLIAPLDQTLHAKLILPALALLAAAACAGSLPEVTPAAEAAYAVRWPAADRAQLRTGRALFIQRCSGCHTLPNPARHDAMGWEKVVAEMSGKARLDADGREAVLRYLIYTGEERRAPKP